MVEMDGEARFTLDCYHLGPHDRVMTTEIIVQLRALCGWDREASAAALIKLTPVFVSLIVGGVTVAEDLTMDELHGGLEHFVRLQIENMGLEGCGITDAQVRDALEDQAGDEQFQREHAAGRIK